MDTGPGQANRWHRWTNHRPERGSCLLYECGYHNKNCAHCVSRAQGYPLSCRQYPCQIRLDKTPAVRGVPEWMPWKNGEQGEKGQTAGKRTWSYLSAGDRNTSTSSPSLLRYASSSVLRILPSRLNRVCTLALTSLDLTEMKRREFEKK